MIRRFSLYGFLKNQRYFEPFIILFFRAQIGLSWTQIGFLIGFKAFCIIIMEIPSGAIADLFGRRRSMMLSFSACIAAFAIFGFSQQYWHLFIAMFFFAIGEAFRTGTHKAMIFTWLRREGRTDEKTKVYGYTRSWSKIGSALSIVLAGAFVWLTKNYNYVFFFAIIPYVLDIINVMSYPRELEGQPGTRVGIRDVVSHLGGCLRDAMKLRRLRRLIIESMSFEGVHKAVEDYLQPIIMSAALLIPYMAGMDDIRRITPLIVAVYVILYLVSAFASRKSHLLSDRAGGEEKGSRLLWKMVFTIYITLIPLLFFGYYLEAVIGFILLSLIQNFWRPVLISRFDAYASETHGATILSIESLAKSFSTMIVAPILGVAVDFISDRQGPGGDFWPVAAIAAVFALLMLLAPLKDKGNGTEALECADVCMVDADDIDT
ncbi:MFS transporter [Chloroflexota bacterium]